MLKEALIAVLAFFVFGFTTATWANDDIVARSKKDSVLVGLGSSAIIAFAFTPIENTIFVTFSFDREPEEVRAWWDAKQGDDKEHPYEVKQEVHNTEKNIYTYSFVFDPAAIQEKEYTLYFGCNSAISGYPNYRGPYVKDGKLHVEDSGKEVELDLPLSKPYSQYYDATKNLKAGNVEGVYQSAILGYDSKYPYLFKIAVEYTSNDPLGVSWSPSGKDKKSQEGIRTYDFDGKKGNYVHLYTFDTRKMPKKFSIYAGSWLVVSVNGQKIKDERGGMRTLSENATYFTSPIPEYK